ncbi:MAG: PIN domain-containing protein [Chloroflexota bacterium]
MRTCLDSWAVLAWLDGDKPAQQRVESALHERPIISWVNAVEVYDSVERDHGRSEADQALSELRQLLEFELPGVVRMVETARIKAQLPIALADCFAIATASAHSVPLLTGDPEILERDVPCVTVDVRETSK